MTGTGGIPIVYPPTELNGSAAMDVPNISY